jgi:hypothetical protein
MVEANPAYLSENSPAMRRCGAVLHDYHRDYGAFDLECWGNGFAYALTHKATNRQVFVQGDDATRFENDRKACEAAFPNKTDEEVMAWLWDQCDYGSAAYAL